MHAQSVREVANLDEQPFAPQPPTGPNGEPVPNADGNGIGVTTIPIPQENLPKTTLSQDPAAPTGAGESIHANQ